jgi:hypothetical protein
MTKSKIRSKFKTPTHYNPYATILTPAQRKATYGNLSVPIKGSKPKSAPSPYMGSRVNAVNRKSYETAQVEYFKERYTQDVVKKRENIEAQKDKTQDQIDLEVDIFNKAQISEEELDSMAFRFGKYQVNKENKHYKAWLKGKSSFVYKGQTFPVLTEKFLNNSKSIKDIIKVEENGVNTTGYSEVADYTELSGDNEVRDDETIRPDTVSQEASGS